MGPNACRETADPTLIILAGRTGTAAAVRRTRCAALLVARKVRAKAEHFVGIREVDALDPVIVALQTREIVVIHHECVSPLSRALSCSRYRSRASILDRDCGYSHASTPVIQKALKSRTPDGAHPLVDAISLQEFSDPKESVREDVAFLRTNPLVHPESMISGWCYSVKNGELTRVI